MWHDILVALALVLVIEGILPFLNPAGWRDMMLSAAKMEDRSLRIVGLVSMVLGVVVLYLVN